MLNEAHGEYVLKDYEFRSGERLDELRVHCATLGSPRRSGGRITNAVLFLHWTGASGASLLSDPFRDSLFSPGQALDLERYYVIVPDNVGHGRSSKPSDGLRTRFPRYGYRDMVDLQRRLVVEELGIQRLQLILGLSMGGMHAWMWGQEFRDAMDGLMPIVCQPARIRGRNLLWRRIVSHAVRSDPGWHGGEHTDQPSGFSAIFPLVQMMLGGVHHLEASIATREDADAFVSGGSLAAKSSFDATDFIYSLESSFDYDPTRLEEIKAHVLALNFEDDEFNPAELGVTPSAMNKVANGIFRLVPTSAATRGHGSQMHPSLWAEHVKGFLDSLPQG
jgi:homoserine O-acetyltransferase